MDKGPKIPWTKERFEKQIEAAQEEIDAINILLNKTFNAMSTIVEERVHLRKKMSRKQKYINKLQKTIIENFKTETE